MRTFKPSISYRLQLSFFFCAIFIFLIGLVCLYSWQEQNKQVEYSLDEYLPKIQTSIQLDETLNILFFEFNEFSQSASTQSRLVQKEQINQNLVKLRQISLQLSPEHQHLLNEKIEIIQNLLIQMDKTIYNNLLIREKLSEFETYIYWLHNDFTSELSSLLQDISWQQDSLLEHLKQNRFTSYSQTSFESLQDELNAMAILTSFENNIIEILNKLIDPQNLDMTEKNLNYLSYLQSNFIEQKYVLPSSTIALQQITHELFQFGLDEQQLSTQLADYKQSLDALHGNIILKDQILKNARNDLDNQLNNQHQQLKNLSEKVKKASNISATIIMATTLLAILFIVLFNFLYIRPKIISRFIQLNRAVIELSKGHLHTPIPIHGTDELASIANLLRKTITQINNQTQRLREEISDRIQIENNLRMTQDELIQAAKLAVVGQTMTTLAHEINQPLNALSIYLFTAKNAIEQQDTAQALTSLNHIKSLTERINAIIVQLRQYTKRSDGNQPLVSINLNQAINNAWSIVSLNKTYQISLKVPDNLGFVMGNSVRIEQVFVNIFTNAIDACHSQIAHIIVNKEETDDKIRLFVQDNGTGWDLQLADKLLKPFTTSKDVGLGIGLSLSQSIMQQNQGALHIASTLQHNALIVLEFRKDLHVNSQ